MQGGGAYNRKMTNDYILTDLSDGGAAHSILVTEGILERRK